MGICRQRIFLALACAGLFLVARPVFCDDDLDFSTDSFSPDSVTLAQHKWHLRLGAGGSFLASSYKGRIPSITGEFTEQNGDQLFFFYAGIQSTPLDVPLHNAGEFEGSLTRDITPSLSVGLMGGATTGHDNTVNFDQAFPGATLVNISGQPFAVDFRYELRANKVMPMAQYGPRYTFGDIQMRPYVMGAIGGYQIAQTVYVVLSDNTEEYSGNTAYYLGAAGGVGLGATFHRNYTTAVEVRYERVFSPGQTLAFYVPTMQFGYLF